MFSFDRISEVYTLYRVPFRPQEHMHTWALLTPVGKTFASLLGISVCGPEESVYACIDIFLPPPGRIGDGRNSPYKITGTIIHSAVHPPSLVK